MMISGKLFCATLDSTIKVSLMNSDGYLKSQWQFIDREEATESHGATAALSTYLIIDSNQSWLKIAPILRDDDGKLFADLMQTMTVFPDDIQQI